MPATAEARISVVSPLTLSSRASRIQSRPTSNPFMSPDSVENEQAEESREEGEQEERPPSRADEAPEWISPEERHNGESGWIHTIPGSGASEKVHVPSRDNVLVFPVLPGQESHSGHGIESITPKKSRRICGAKYLIAISIILAAVIIAIALGVGLALGGSLPQNQNSSSSPDQSASTAAVDGKATPTSIASGNSPSDATSMSVTVISAPVPTTVVTISGSSRAAAARFNFVNDQLATIGIAAVQGGSATGTITLASVSEPAAGATQTAGVFHSTAFSPAAFASSITYSAARPGATDGVGVVDCPASNGTRYVAGNGAVFRKLCYSDVADARDVSSTLVASLEGCVDACVQALSPGKRGVDDNGGDAAGQCQSVAYSANITLAFGQQGANCWFKSAIGVPSAGDWQQSTASFVGWLADS